MTECLAINHAVVELSFEVNRFQISHDILYVKCKSRDGKEICESKRNGRKVRQRSASVYNQLSC